MRVTRNLSWASERLGRLPKLLMFVSVAFFLSASPAWADIDTDNDGLSNERETGKSLDGTGPFGSDPTKADTDGGGVGDLAEYFLGLDPNDPSDDVMTCATKWDCDGDGLSDERELFFGSDPFKTDTDGGGKSDKEEYLASVENSNLGNPLDASDDSQITITVDPAYGDLSGGKFGGCATTSGGPFGWGSLLFFGLLGLLGIRRRRLVAMAAVLTVPAVATAQNFNEKIDIQNLRPQANIFNHYVSQVSPHAILNDQWTLGLFGQFADDPLVALGTDGKRVGDLVHQHINGHLIGSMSFGRLVEMGIDVGVVMQQSGDDEIAGFSEGDLIKNSIGLQDIRLMPKVILFSGVTAETNAGYSLAIASDFFFPTGDAENFTSEGFRMEPRLAFGYQWAGGSSFAVNGGYLFRESKRYRNVEVDDQITYGAAFDWAATDTLHVIPEVDGGYTIAADEVEESGMPLEALLSVKYVGAHIGGLVGGGIGLLEGLGTPDYRVFGALQFRGFFTEAEPEPVDSDGDGINDDTDKCPAEAEDKDGFQDEDGCPDLDNDGDGIADADDKCPDQAEDMDGVEDEDGCPDETKDQDGDGILDAADKCPTEAEDKDGFEDEDGCPDLDNDGDGIADAKDKCPNKAEVINNVEDEDGCPDTVKVVVTCEKIELKDKVFFDVGKATIKAESHDLLNQVAAILKNHPDIKVVRAEGHTDSQGSDRTNRKLSQARVDAVMSYITEQGIEAKRIKAKGYGEKKPIASNKTEEGRAKNRRVEFRILTRNVKECKKKAKEAAEKKAAEETAKAQEAVKKAKEAAKKVEEAEKAKGK